MQREMILLSLVKNRENEVHQSYLYLHVPACTCLSLHIHAYICLYLPPLTQACLGLHAPCAACTPTHAHSYDYSSDLPSMPSLVSRPG